MSIERNAQVTGTSQSDEPANTDSPTTAGTRARLGSGDDQHQPPIENLLAMLFLMDTAQARALAAQLKQSPQDRDQRISALQRAMAEGTYQASPEQTAEAMLDEQQVRDGTAA